jgi:hypothetical protein
MFDLREGASAGMECLEGTNACLITLPRARSSSSAAMPARNRESRVFRCSHTILDEPCPIPCSMLANRIGAVDLKRLYP